MLQAEQQGSVVVLQAGAVEVDYSAASKAAGLVCSAAGKSSQRSVRVAVRCQRQVVSVGKSARNFVG